MQVINEGKGWIMRNLLRIAILLLTVSVAFGQNSKFGRDLQGISPNSKVDVIIQYNHGVVPWGETNS